MIPVLTVEEMKNIDKAACFSPEQGYKYMEKAAAGLLELIQNFTKDKNIDDIRNFPEVTIVCGKGNNGGDALSLALYLSQLHYRVSCYCLAAANDYKGEAQLAYEKLNDSQSKNQVQVIHPLTNESEFEAFKNNINNQRSGFIVDGILGIGANRDPEGFYAKTINEINDIKQRKKDQLKVIAIDIPSGVESDTGKLFNPAINADVTLTMGFPKIGMFYYPAKANIGLLLIKDLDYPEEIVNQYYQTKTYILSRDVLKSFLPARKEAGSKFDHGVAFSLVGSEGMSGAAILSTEAALRSGIGMVHVVSDESILSIIGTSIEEAVLHPLKVDTLYQGCMTIIDKSQANVACIGPGISFKEEIISLVHKLVKNIDIPIVLDADGINAFRHHADELKAHKSELLITPHAGELRRLFGETIEEIAQNVEHGSNPVLRRINYVKKKAKEYNMSILFKGSPTVVADPNGMAFILPYGNSGMATAGSGDVLTGIITSILAQSLTDHNYKIQLKNEESNITKTTCAALLGAYIHGASGEFAAQELTEYSMIASDLVKYLHKAIRSLLQ